MDLHNPKEAVDINKQRAVNEVKTYEKMEDAIQPKKERASSDTTIFRGALMITNLCFGVTIFTFAINQYISALFGS